ncbi:hypothetical protein NSTC745_00581 [Nostoc sp. DSM 114161]|jgi:hypothetical protein
MKRTWKSLLLACNWVLLSIGTSILIILTQPTAPVPAQEPAASTTVETTQDQKLPEAIEPSSTKEPSPEVSQPKKPESPQEPTLSPEEISRQLKFIEADRLYLAGQINSRSRKNLPRSKRTFYQNKHTPRT